MVNALDTYSLEVCRVINELQKELFSVDKRMLRFLPENPDILSQVGLLLPSWLAKVNPHIVYDILRKELSSIENKKFKFNNLVAILDNRIQGARHEQFIIRLVRAYQDYGFDFPAFIDFRGRIYRTGVFNFHERDFVKSLILKIDHPL